MRSGDSIKKTDPPFGKTNIKIKDNIKKTLLYKSEVFIILFDNFGLRYNSTHISKDEIKDKNILLKMKKKIKICNKNELKRNSINLIKCNEKEILIIKSNDEIFLTSSICLHMGAPLVNGKLTKNIYSAHGMDVNGILKMVNV